ncbi:MAG: hypothetical protein FWC20_11325 [Oscillospiraceae bacterium]|nr:hypothetical protein [Oscillospiraceae bacterium]MCL2279977.1 hypothetical protein [Oscillospiraceae bacterium]
MFCSSCGGKLQEGAAFCPGCGTQSDGNVATQAATVQAYTTRVRDFQCNNCGSPLKIPTNSNAAVRCPSCKTECLIERAIKNAEIASKENIESGIPLTATPSELHSIVVSVLTSSPAMPLDVFKKVEVVREEHYCVPAYVFHCNGTESFNYEVGNERSQTYTVDRGDSVDVREKTRMEWAPSSGTASVRKVILASGNRDLNNHVNSLYANFDTNKLVDIEELIFPANVDTLNANYPQTAAFNEIAVPIVEKELKEKAEDQIRKQTTTGLSFGGASIQKDTVRIFLGMYRVVFSYGEDEHSVWINGDGSNWWWNEGVPEDSSLKAAIDNKNQAMEQEVEAVPVPKTWYYTLGAVGSVVLGIVLLGVMGEFGLILGIIGAIVLLLLKRRMWKPYNKKCEDIRTRFQQEIDTLEAGIKNATQKFKSEKNALRGIYEKVSGDSGAF